MSKPCYVISKQTVNRASMVQTHGLLYTATEESPLPSFMLLVALQPTESLAGPEEQGRYCLCEWQERTFPKAYKVTTSRRHAT